MKEKIFFYYTSDLHSHFENWPQIIGYFKKQKQKHERNGESYWILDNGDHVDRFHPIAEGLMGKGNVELLNKAGYNLANLGNNEGITLAHEDLLTLYNEAAFDVVCANLSVMEGAQPEWLKPYSIITSKRGLKIGVIGLTAPFETFYKMLGWEINNPFDVLDRMLDEVQQKADIVVLLSHLGINDDEEIARKYSGIDLIIGGHTHHLFQNGEYTNKSLLTAAGKHGTHLGEVMIEWDLEKHSIVKKEAYAVPTEHMAKDEETTSQVIEMRNEAIAYLQEPVAALKEPLYIAWFQETPLMKQLTFEMQKWTGADIAMLNAGVLLDHLSSGAITFQDVHRICPHPMNPCKVELYGDEVLEVIRVAHTKKLTEMRLKGFGFRGEVIGRMIFTGVEIKTSQESNGEEHVDKVLINGELIQTDRLYTLATADTFTFGSLFPEIAYSKKKKYYMPELLRDLLTRALQTLST
ncbi:bifunctional metallophosphatase/5'-nucleotidase [Halobacillus salinarum]|uniref:Bifunctional metallophosphatase/5'-nucleotidase n=1 Tax=Halobacillus salinarum TaxID=2932257 RepID=A0ABY4EQW3_9BACI|nr:bifunctional UDP-sugar hydrolase/5'-nucleotidase [Halobacillus salinarum]UOQ46034.1 bifunctional metallophosphatase/5'-nucleotidase [Halobacillus salinarum]